MSDTDTHRPRRARRKGSVGLGWRTMGRMGVRMMFHDKFKMAGTLFGVIFATVLSMQQAGVFFGLLHRNNMFVANQEADVWVMPPGTTTFRSGPRFSKMKLYQAQTTEGVAWAEPLILGGAEISFPGGGGERLTIVGTERPRYAGGPWNMVAGDVDSLRFPNSIILEDSRREALGGVNLGSVREVNRHRSIVGGFTYGLLPFAAPYSFGELYAVHEREGINPADINFILVEALPGADADRVAERLRDRFPDMTVMTRPEFITSINWSVVTDTPIGVTLGTSTAFGLLIGLIIVSLSMFSSVIDNLQDFGIVKALGARTRDLAQLLFVQAILYALLGTLIGLVVVITVSEAVRSPDLAMVYPDYLFGVVVVMMMALCLVASGLALLRLHNVEPAMVFK